MTGMDAGDVLSGILASGVQLRSAEPGIYSAFADASDEPTLYDRWFGAVYEAVACNSLYNRLVWGYSVSEYHGFCQEALRSSPDGLVLDAGCGSLAFTAKTYLTSTARPVVLMDNSIRMLRMAKARLVGLNGSLPQNMSFVHADAMSLPFARDAFSTVISLNLLHAVADPSVVLRGLRTALAMGGSMYFTTLVLNKTRADGYLNKLARDGYMIARTRDELLGIFDREEMQTESRTIGNLAFIKHKSTTK